VTVSPADTVSVAGANARDAEAVIVRGSGTSGGVAGNELPNAAPSRLAILQML